MDSLSEGKRGASRSTTAAVCVLPSARSSSLRAQLLATRFSPARLHGWHSGGRRSRNAPFNARMAVAELRKGKVLGQKDLACHATELWPTFCHESIECAMLDQPPLRCSSVESWSVRVISRGVASTWTGFGRGTALIVPNLAQYPLCTERDRKQARINVGMGTEGMEVRL